MRRPIKICIARAVALGWVIMFCNTPPPARGDALESLYAERDDRAEVREREDVLQRDPRNAEARLSHREAYPHHRDDAGAEAQFRRAADLGGVAEPSPVPMIEALLLQGRYLEVLDRVEALAPELSDAERADAFALSGRAKLELKRFAAAKEAYRLAREADPNNERAALGQIQLSLVAGDYDAGAVAVREFLARFPDSVDGLLLAAGIERARNEPENALGYYDRAIALAPADVRALLGAAAVRIALGEHAAAEEVLARADAVRHDMPLTSYLRGLSAYKQRDFEAAKRLLESVVVQVPNHVQSAFMLGLIAYREGDLRIADEYLGRVVASMPGNLQAIAALGATRVKLHDAGRAIALLEPAARRARAPILMALLATAYMLEGDRDAAQHWLNEAVEASPEAAGLRAQLALNMLAEGDVSGAIGELQSAIDSGQDLVQTDALLIIAHIKKGEFDAALAAARSMEARLPDSPVPYNLTGMVYLAQNAYDDADARFEKALAVDPKFITARINLGRSALERGNLDAAEAHYRAALEREPGRLDALIGLATIAARRGDDAALLERLAAARHANPNSVEPGLMLVRYFAASGDTAEALRVANDLSARFPDNTKVRDLLAEARKAVGPTAAPGDEEAPSNTVSSAKTADKITILSERVDAHPDDRDALARLARAYQQAGRTDDAIGAYSRLLEADPRSIALLNNLALLYKKSGDPRALETARAAYEIDPERAEVADTYGWILVQSGDVRGGLPLLEQARAAYPNHPEIAYHISYALEAVGRTEEAVGILRLALGEGPSEPLRRDIEALLARIEGQSAVVDQTETAPW